MMIPSLLLVAAVLSWLSPGASVPCSVMGAEISPTVMVRHADAIVRAAAIEYSKPPSNPSLITTGVPDSIVRFKPVEVIKGEPIRPDLTLPGYLSEYDDFNDQTSPYRFVRPGGRAGSCFANTYRRGAEFLLMLKQTKDGLTVNWYALGPVNEQLKSPEDPWLNWVRQEVKAAAPLERLLAEAFTAKNPKVTRSKILDLRSLAGGTGPYILLGWGIRPDMKFEGQLEDELFGVFVVDKALTRIDRTLDIFPTQRWNDYIVRLDSVTNAEVVVVGYGSYGDQKMRRVYSLNRVP